MFYGASPDIFEKASLLREIMTPAENFLWQRLKRNQFNGFKFRRQHPVKNFIADFYCHTAKLVIEVDGEIHHSDINKEHDEGRTYEIEKFGIKVIRFKNEEIKTNIEKVIETIKSFLSYHPCDPKGSKVSFDLLIFILSFFILLTANLKKAKPEFSHRLFLCSLQGQG